MSDNLVKRLREWWYVYPEDYNKDTGHLYEEAADRIERLEAKLEKVVEALEEIATDEHPLGWIAIAALVELKGKSDG